MKEKTHNNLRLLRILHGDLSQKYVAYKLEVSQPAYSKMERGELIASEKTLKNVCLLYRLVRPEIIFLPIEEIIQRLTDHIVGIEVKKIDQLNMEVKPLKKIKRDVEQFVKITKRLF